MTFLALSTKHFFWQYAFRHYLLIELSGLNSDITIDLRGDKMGIVGSQNCDLKTGTQIPAFIKAILSLLEGLSMLSLIARAI